MSAILLSNTKNNTNTKLINAIRESIGTNKRIAYIPTVSDPERKYFKEVHEFFNQFGSYELTYFSLDDGEWNTEFLDQIKNYDVLYLSGGNTYRLLYNIRLRKLENLISEFFHNKKIIGTSAGGIVLTPRVDISECSNDFNLTDLTGLNLLDFYFYPHYNDSEEVKNKVKNYIKQNLLSGKDVYGLEESSGIIVDDSLHFIGEAWKLHQ